MGAQSEKELAYGALTQRQSSWNQSVRADDIGGWGCTREVMREAENSSQVRRLPDI